MTQLDQWFTDYPEWRPYADLIVVPPTGDEIRKEFPDTSEEVVRRAFDTFWSLVSLGTAYLKMRREGISDRFAAMLALQAPPRLKSNVTFLAGRKPWYELADPRYVEKVRKKLAEKGVSLTPQMEYCPELARYTGDPEAVLPHGQERDHIKKICEQRGWACAGAVECKHREPDRDPFETAPKMADDLIQNKARLLAHKDPGFRKKSRKEQREAVLAKFGPSS
jgi:hypothetical protein